MNTINSQNSTSSQIDIDGYVMNIEATVRLQKNRSKYFKIEELINLHIMINLNEKYILSNVHFIFRLLKEGMYNIHSMHNRFNCYLNGTV